MEFQTARRLTQTLIRAKDEDELLSELAVELLHDSDADSVDILLRDDGEGLVLRASTMSPEFVYRLKLGKGVGLCGEVMATGKPLMVRQGALKMPKYASYPGIDGRESEALLICPVMGPDGKPSGAIEYGKATAWKLAGPKQQELIQRAEMASELLMAYRSAYQSGTQVNRLGALSEVSKTISTSPYVEEILQLLVNLTAQQFNYTVCTVRLLDESRQELVLRATQAPAKAYQRKRAIKLGESIAGKAIVENRAIIVKDVQVEEDYIGHDLAVEQGLRSMICMPLTIQDRAVGVLSCYTSEIHTFGPDEIKALETLAKQAAVSIEHAKLQVRNTLMQEMHHRVKNNLQQIASLLRLQMRHSEYKSLEEALNDVLSRILAIASVHDLLSREDLDHVGLRSITETLVQHQQGSLILPDKRIAFQVRGEDVHLNMTQATQIALVLNELILNAVEHGFDKATSGEIHVNVEEKEDEVSVWVSDSGDKLPENFDLAASSHLGLQIVESLVRALGGKFSLKDIFGWTVAEVKFMRRSAE
ncbi:MAG TPA: GAF domain-containing protein [Fimbriimonadaceae bacterium]|nr:GAF domain-containing protein [Fimbriimonadaceae bacterium]